jgi:hypothetical protein
MFVIPHGLGMFVAAMFKSRRRLEAENLFLRHQLNIALRRAPHAEEFWQGARDHDVKQNTPFQSSSGECRFNRLGGIHGGKKDAPDDSGAITFSGTFSGTLVGTRSGAGAGAGV